MKHVKQIIVETIAVILSIIIFWIPFLFVIITSFKDQTQAAEMNLNLPTTYHIIENYSTVLKAEKGMVIRAFFNSTLITFLSIVILTLICSMAAFPLQRKKGKVSNIISVIALAGLMIPPAIVPTIWVLNGIGLFKTMIGMVLVEVAIATPFSLLLYKSFMTTIPREIDEAAIVDGCGKIKLFFSIIFPLLKPVTATIVVLTSVNIFNDFVNPLYFLPGAKNATIQLTLYNFTGRYASSWNLLFANAVLISIPPLILFIFFNKKIVAGMTSGAIKG